MPRLCGHHRPSDRTRGAEKSADGFGEGWPLANRFTTTYQI